MPDPTHVDSGRYAEDLAAAYLALCGYAVLDRNFRFSRLEIDLVARKENVLAVVEVKFRRRFRKGGALRAVGPRKQRDLETAAVGYLRVREVRGVRVRFDVIAIETGTNGLTLRHVPNAFPATGRYRA